MDHEHDRDGPAECKHCEQRRTGDFGQGSREQSFRALAGDSKSNVRRSNSG